MTSPNASAIGLDVFYPIVPDIHWLERIVPLGVRTIQLRAKDMDDADVRRHITKSIEICGVYNCQLIINDHWQLAIEAGADFIHLGQEDLADADLAAIKEAKLKLGISTHSEHELSIALAAKPDYVALGPVYETKLKAMRWAPQGLDNVRLWKNKIGERPLVGIAGITIERADDVIAAGAQSVAAITDFLTHAEPEQRIRKWLNWAAKYRA